MSVLIYKVNFCVGSSSLESFLTSLTSSSLIIDILSEGALL